MYLQRAISFYRVGPFTTWYGYQFLLDLARNCGLSFWYISTRAIFCLYSTSLGVILLLKYNKLLYLPSSYIIEISKKKYIGFPTQKCRSAEETNYQEIKNEFSMLVPYKKLILTRFSINKK